MLARELSPADRRLRRARRRYEGTEATQGGWTETERRHADGGRARLARGATARAGRAGPPEREGRQGALLSQFEHVVRRSDRDATRCLARVEFTTCTVFIRGSPVSQP